MKTTNKTMENRLCCHFSKLITRRRAVSANIVNIVGVSFSTVRNPTFQRVKQVKIDDKKELEKNPQPIALTNYPSIYTTQLIGPDYDISNQLPIKQKIFDQTYSCYLPPEEFNFLLPSKNKCEVAFIGRSNVGKSSLIDCLLGNKKIVRISKEAGCTTQINFFSYIKGYARDFIPKKDKKFQEDEHIFYLVDMPGYGFAKRSKQMIKQWDMALDKYLLNRNQSTLRRVYILVDSRLGLKLADTHMMDTLNKASIPYQLIFTKCDAASPAIIKAGLKSAFEIILSMKNNTCLPYIHTVSVKKNEGIDELKLFISDIILQNWTHQQHDI